MLPVHLTCRSHYSLLTALGSPEKLAQRAKELGYETLALTDLSNAHGAIEFYSACQKAGVRPIIGAEFHVAPRTIHDKDPQDAQTSTLTLLAQDNVGYEHLLQLITIAQLEGYHQKPRVDWTLLSQHSQGLFCLVTGPQSVLMTPLLQGGSEEALEGVIASLDQAFSDRWAIGIERHHKTQPLVLAQEPQLRSLASAHGREIVASHSVHYPALPDAPAQDILQCIRENAQREDPSRPSLQEDDYSLLSPEQFRSLFSDIPEALEATVRIADSCQVELHFDQVLLPPFSVPDGMTQAQYLMQVCREGLRDRYGIALDVRAEADERVERLEFELSIIERMGFPSYFLIVWDFVRWAREQEIAVGPGRGSAAGSLVSYVLGITNIDPLQYDLLFERFLNPERISMPDIDIDFADDRRDEVVEYVRQKYGADQVAQICTFGTLAARAAVKDVGRVLGVDFMEMNHFAKLIPEKPGISLDEAYDTAPDLRAALESNDRYREVWDIAQRLEGGVRHVSVHACAVVIAPDSLSHYTALQRAPKDEHTIITQLSQKPIEKLGMLKMDFLGLKNLTIMENAKKIIAQRHGIQIDLDTIPLDSQPAYEMLSRGQTTGVFQLESAGMRRYLKQLKPSTIDDIIAMVSLYRPGPMAFIPDYIEGKDGTKAPHYVHEDLKPILEKTYGIAIYQEQILQIARDFAGFSLGEADLLRRAIGKKIASELQAQRAKFIDGAVQNDYEKDLAVSIFDDVIEPFAQYGFNKSHAAGYAMIAYQTAYLKAAYPTEFMTALLQSDRDNTDRIVIDIEECKEMDIRVLSPDVNVSGVNFTVSDDSEIRFGLAAIKGIGESVVSEILTAREAGGLFSSLADFCRRVPPKSVSKRSLEALAKSGALSGLGEVASILHHIPVLTAYSKAAQKESVSDGQESLFGGMDVPQQAELTLDPIEPATDLMRLSWERETLGIFVSGHPLEPYASYLRDHATSVRAFRSKKGKVVKTVGFLTSVRRLTTRKGEQMAILQMEDDTGMTDVAVFPGAYSEISPFLSEDDPSLCWIQGKVDYRNGEYQIIAEKLWRQSMEDFVQMTLAGDTPSQSKSTSQEASADIVLTLKEDLAEVDLHKISYTLQQMPGECIIELVYKGSTLRLPHTVCEEETLRERLGDYLA